MLKEECLKLLLPFHMGKSSLWGLGVVGCWGGGVRVCSGVCFGRLGFVVCFGRLGFVVCFGCLGFKV